MKRNDPAIVVETPAVDFMTADPATLSKENLKARYDANIAERKRLAEENTVLTDLYKNASSTAKRSSAEAKIAELTARLAALQATPAPKTVSAPAPEAEAIAG